jgi:predicted dehydrogenase
VGHLQGQGNRTFASATAGSGEKDVARIALVGAGWWSQGWHLPHLHRNPKAKIVAIVDPTPHPVSPMNPDMQSVAALSKQYAAPAFDSLEELLATDIELDGVVIGSNHASHHQLATKAMEAGYHVMCEKPMTVDINEAKDLVAKAAATDKVFMVNNTANWREKTRQAQAIVAAGDIGEIRHASVLFHAPLSWVFNDPENKGWNEPSGTMTGNGFGWGQLAHPLAWLYMVSGLTPAKVFSFNGKGTETPADMYDSCSILCTNGATVTVSGVAAIPGDDKIIENRLIGTEGILSYCGVDEDKGKTSGDAPGKAESEVQGNAGGLSLLRFDGRKEDFSGFEFENTDQDGDGPESLQNFLDACLGREYFPGADANVGLKAVATLDAMYRSAVSGKAEPTHL